MNWKREGFYYVTRLPFEYKGATGTCIRKLDLVSYHLIRWVHGSDKLKEMALAKPRGLT